LGWRPEPGQREEIQIEHMAATPSRIAEITPEIEAVAQAAGCELVHAELKGGVLRLFVDKPEGVTLADCEHVSRQVSALLDVLDFGAGRYVLEVSSPGLDRQLYKPRDYERFAGRLARVTYEDPETGKKRTDVARLQGLRRAAEEPEERAKVLLEDGRTGEVRELPLSNVRLARLEIEL
jgi:ribosome maturation factor RimP